MRSSSPFFLDEEEGVRTKIRRPFEIPDSAEEFISSADVKKYSIINKKIGQLESKLKKIETDTERYDKELGRASSWITGGTFALGVAFLVILAPIAIEYLTKPDALEMAKKIEQQEKDTERHDEILRCFLNIGGFSSRCYR